MKKLSAAIISAFCLTVSTQAKAEITNSPAYIEQASFASFKTISMEDLIRPTMQLVSALPKPSEFSSSFTSQGSLAYVLQDGHDNFASIEQSGSRNLGLIRQIGAYNSATITQQGTGHAGFIFQQGRNNVAILRQR